MSLFSVTKFIFVSIQILLAAGSNIENIIDTGCSRDSDCKEFESINQIANATCINHQCLCRDSDFKTIQCFPQKQGFSNVIGGKCPCGSIKWSSCVDGFCMCNPDFTSSEDYRSCIPKHVPLGDRCENDVQCSKVTTFAACKNHTCTCKSEYTRHNGTCQSLIVLGKECESNSSCIPNTICESQKCFCEPGYVAKFDRTACLPNADYNKDCVESAQCQEKLGSGAVCEQSKCVCDEDFLTVTVTSNVANETRSMCERRIVIDQECSYDVDCFQSLTEQSMRCDLKKCQCAEDYEQDRDQRFCIKSKHTERENTWFDSVLMKISSAFTSSAGNRNKCICYLMIMVCVVSIISIV